jgi:UDP-3-O-[3-hydroxymyristoyl] glucosamine N-acyltransferase
VAESRVRLSDLAAQLDLEVEGDPDVAISGVAPLDDAGPEDLTFVRSAAFAERLAKTAAAAVIALPGLDVAGRPALRSEDPSRDFYRAARILVPSPAPPAGIDDAARVEETATVDPTACVGPGCYLGAGARVGARTILHPGVTLYAGVQVGADCVLHARVVIAAASRLGDRVRLAPGVVIGGEGFGYVGGSDGGLAAIYNVGRVVIEDDVDVGANSTIDRGTLADTRIGRGTKIDNLVQIGHNCRIGERVVIVAQVGVAGSAVIESGSVVMAQAGIAGHLRVGPNAFVGPQSGIHKDVPEGQRVLGTPQRVDRDFHREAAALSHLPALLRRVRALERAQRDDDGGESE